MRETKEEGALTLEATLSLTCFMFVVLVIISFGRVFQAQNFVTHAMLQSAEAISYLSFQYSFNDGAENEGIINFLESMEDTAGGLAHNGISWDSFAKMELRRKYHNKDAAGMAETIFPFVSIDKNSNLSEVKKRYCIESIDFSGSTISDGKINLKASYKVWLPFGFLGFKVIHLHQEVQSSLWAV